MDKFFFCLLFKTSMACCNPCGNFPPINPYMCVMPSPPPVIIAQESAVWPTNSNASTERAWTTLSTRGTCAPSVICNVVPGDMLSDGIFQKLSVQVTPQSVEGRPYTAMVTVIVTGQQITAGVPAAVATIRAYSSLVCFYGPCPATADFSFTEASTPIAYAFKNTPTFATSVARVDISVVFQGC